MYDKKTYTFIQAGTFRQYKRPDKSFIDRIGKAFAVAKLGRRRVAVCLVLTELLGIPSYSPQKANLKTIQAHEQPICM